ncbi:MAG TPA: S8 family serine peptidase [Verrucomicrobiae bacterium]
MNHPFKQTTVLIFVFAGFFCATVRAQNLEVVGVTLLRSVATNVDGSGIRVAQPEAYDNGTTNWEVNPANSLVQQPVNLFTYTSALGSTNNFPNTLNNESSHADGVAGNFYGVPAGVATNVVHVDNYDANYFYTSIIEASNPANINDAVVNQSFVFGPLSANQQQQVDQVYDNYAARYNTLFVSGAGNGGMVMAAATSYNGIGVGVSDGSSSIGPTLDNGRAKPDIIAPGGATSFSTPYVSGAASILMQAGLRGDGGSDTNSAADIRTLKALLLNGAIKPVDWTNDAPSPLDPRYGAGVLNVFNSYEQLAGGEHGYIISASIPTNSPHPVTGDAGTVSRLSGWDFNTNSSSATNDGVNHYYFDVTNNLSNATFTATATLVWNRHKNKTDINNLDLFLYDVISSNLVAGSTSLVDNVEHIFVPGLPQGRYDLQVFKSGGAIVSRDETYALAFEFFSMPIAIAKSGTNAILNWPIYPMGFVLQSTTNLSPPIVWNTNNPARVVTNHQNFVTFGVTNANQFFRLRRP